MRLYQHVIAGEGDPTGYEKAVVTVVEEPPRRVMGQDWYLDGVIVQIPVPMWNFIPAAERVDSPWKRCNVEGWMFPCFAAYETPAGKSWAFFWRPWKVREKSVVPDIAYPTDRLPKG